MGILDWFKGTPAVHPTAIRSIPEFRSLVEEAEIPVILEVWSDSCPPCRKMIPVLATVATRYAGQVRVVTVGTDAEAALLRSLRVKSTPTLIIYEDGGEIGRMVGFRPEGWFHQMIKAEFPQVSA